MFRTSHHSGPLEVELTRRNIPFVKFGGLKFLDSAHVKDMLALLRFVENPRDRVAGFRLMHFCRASGRPRRSACWIAWPKPPIRLPHCAIFPSPPRAGEDWQAFVRCDRRDLRDAAMAGRDRAGAALVRTASRSHPRGRRGPARRSDPAGTDRKRLSVARAFPDRADTRSARCDQRSGRRAAA